MRSMSFPPDTLRIFVSDLERAREFYEGTMGWTFVTSEEGWLCFATETISVVIELIHPGHPEDEGAGRPFHRALADQQGHPLRLCPAKGIGESASRTRPRVGNGAAGWRISWICREIRSRWCSGKDDAPMKADSRALASGWWRFFRCGR